MDLFCPTPALAIAGLEELSWLPGIGTRQAERLLRERNAGVRQLSLDNLYLLPGFGEQTVDQLRRWYEAHEN
ncbi:MAG: helix-hairpin-helix domain-containing protein [Planctomycetes bacterium]|nr:helix-hairpin-helix domain-containing protein [Planctomycetota bacterium]